MLRAAGIAAVCLTLFACNEVQQQPIWRAYPSWTAIYSAGVTFVGDHFDFPQQDGVHYIVKSMAVTPGQTMTMNFDLTGTQFVPAPYAGTGPARVRLYIGPKDFTKSYWSVASIVLQQGNFTLSAKLDPAQWSNINGKMASDDPAMFDLALTTLLNAGFTFGAEFYGHGVYAIGPARFTLRSFDVR